MQGKLWCRNSHLSPTFGKLSAGNSRKNNASVSKRIQSSIYFNHNLETISTSRFINSSFFRRNLDIMFSISNFYTCSYFTHDDLGGGHCNFMHLKHLSRSFKKCLFKEMHEKFPEYKEKAKKRHKRRR